MKMRFLVRVAGIILLGTSFLVTGGCGFKNKPVPPASVVPQAIDDLRYTITEKGTQLSWSYPIRTIKGSELDDISSFALFRAEIPLDEYCGTCSIPYAEPIAVDGGAPRDGETRKTAVYDTDLLRSGHKYFFKVRSRTSWFAESEDSNVVTFVWFQPAAAPDNVKAVAGDRQVSLTWPAVGLKDGGQDFAVNYQVRRSTDGKTWAKVGDPLAATSYSDRQVANGQKYLYTVQTLTVYKKEASEGGISSAVAATPVDQTPLPSPTGVSAVQTDAGIKIFWDRSQAPDLGGYQVYRRAADQSEYQMIGKVEPQFTLFVDAKAAENVRYYYAVTTLDTASPANESSKSREATMRD